VDPRRPALAPEIDQQLLKQTFKQFVETHEKLPEQNPKLLAIAISMTETIDSLNSKFPDSLIPYNWITKNFGSDSKILDVFFSNSGKLDTTLTSDL
jgi:hypothetical protein